MNEYDIAVLLLLLDLPYLQERELIKKIHVDLERDEELSEFILKVDAQLERLDPVALKERKELPIQNDCEYAQDMAHYVKVIKLRLVYTDTKLVKLKLRTLLKQLGYKRRSEKLIFELTKLFDAFQLDVFKKGGIRCELSELPLDEFMTIRLRSEEVV